MRLTPEAMRNLVQSDPKKAAELISKFRRATAVLARSDPDAFMEYVFKDDRTGRSIRQSDVHRVLQDIATHEKRACVWTCAELGKAVPLSTEIPTPNGWTTMGDLQVGDEVFARDGSICTVGWCSEVQQDRRILRVEFDDGDAVLADADHLWLANDKTGRDRHHAAQVVNTQQMFDRIREHWSIPLTESVQYPSCNLPVHPYVFGAWIGDGNSSGTILTFHEDDREVFDRCQELTGVSFPAVRIPGREHLMRGRIGGGLKDAEGMTRALKELGMIGKKGTKYIPKMYLTASEDQRRELLAGLLDTDGSVTRGRGNSSSVEFTSSVLQIAEDVLELVRSLGFKARLKTHDAKINGRYVGKRYRVFFTARVPVFKLARKLAMQNLGRASGSKANLRYVVRISTEPSVPVKCIRVSSSDHCFLMGRSYTVTHNCETTGAPILMADGSWKNIESLSERSEIMALDPVKLELRRVWAGPVVNNGLKPVIRFVTVTGRVITVTHEHPLYVKGRGWIAAKDIKPSPKGNPELLIAAHTDMPWVGHGPGALTVDEASLAGFLTDACFSAVSGKYSTFWPKQKEMQKELKRVCGLMGWKLGEKKMGRICIDAPEGGDRVGDIAASFIKGANWSARTREFRISDAIFQSSDDCVFAYLRALFSRANVGSWARGGTTLHSYPVSFMTDSYEFAHDLQLLATRLGGLLSIKLTPRKRSTKPRQCEENVIEKPAHEDRPKAPLTDKHWEGFQGKCWLVSFADQSQATLFWNRADVPAMGVFEKLAIVEPYYPRQTWALEVHDPCHCYISAGIVSHNTTQLSVGHTLWKLGRNPNGSTIVISNTKDQAQKIIGQMKGLIQNSDRLHDVFPNLRPGKKWAEYSFTVERDTERRDPSVQACGLGGNIQGARADNLLIDDIDDEASTLTPAARAGTLRWVQATAFSRLGEDSQVLCVGNTWDDEDLMHSLAKLEGWASYKFPVLNEKGESNWPDKFSMERIQKIRQDLGDLQFARMYMCEPIDEATARFRPEWIGNALAAGTGLHMLSDLDNIPPGGVTITGVDLGVREKKGSDPTAMVTVLLRPDKKVEILNIEAGLWSAPEIADRIVSIHRRFMSTVFVESNAAQSFILQIVQSLGERVPVKAFATGRNKHDPIYGVESLAVEMSTNQWVIPTTDGTRLGCHNEIRKLIEEMIVYAPNKHTGDRLMAMWIAREAGRIKGPGKAQVGKFRRF